MVATCATCDAWKAITRDNGWCRARAPQAGVANFPQALASDWCREYIAVPTAAPVEGTDVPVADPNP